MTIPLQTMSPRDTWLHNLFILRLCGLMLQIGVLAVAQWKLHILLPLATLLWVLALSMVWVVLTGWRLTRLWSVTAWTYSGQLLVDMSILGMLLYFTGGASNPFVSLFLLPVIIAATVLPTRFAWAISGLSIVTYTLLSHWYVPMVLPSGAVAFRLHLLGMWLNFILSAVLITGFVGRMAHSIRVRDQALVRIREQRLRDEQIVALGSLAAGAAHELSTPLATMNVVTGELLEDFTEDPELQPSLALLQQQIGLCKNILTRLTQQAQNARSNSGHLQTVDAWLLSVLDQWQLMRPQVQLQIRWLSALPAPEIIVGEALGQAVLNLCNNAADAGNNQMELEVTWDAQKIHIDILDRGAGFDSAWPLGLGFFTTKHEQGGSGIGLMLANASIEQYGGKVSLHQRNDGGARVKVSLPIFVSKEQT
ncbi:MAG: ATP-binding protein [Betaproteobacteria bacterium]|nr:ATP-binding protein [Betaproteobacteria bacterium]